MRYINEKMVKPVVIGGITTGILLSIFILVYEGTGCFCCLLYILSGIITAYLLTQEYLPSDRDYLIAGALSGGIAGFISWLLYALKVVLLSLLYNTVSMSSVIGMKMGMISFIGFALLLLINFFVYLLAGITFGVVGAILYRVVTEEIMKR